MTNWDHLGTLTYKFIWINFNQIQLTFGVRIIKNTEIVHVTIGDDYF